MADERMYPYFGNPLKAATDATGKVVGVLNPQSDSERSPVVVATTDAVTGLFTGLSASGVTALALKMAALTPYRMALFGDSRANAGSNRVQASPGGISGEKVPGCLQRIRGDIDIVFNGGISGDTAVNWNSASRISSAQTVKELLLATPDLCYIQYGINDIIAGTADTVIVAALKALINKILGAGVPVIFESVNPCATGSISYINGYGASGGYGASYAAKALVQQSVNSLMQAWLAQFPGNIALYVDTSAASTATDGYAKSDKSYYDGTHMSSIGCMAAATIINAAMQSYWPTRRGQRIKPAWPNGLNRSLLTPSSGRAANFSAIANESGTATSTYQTIVDADGDLCQEYNVTISALSSGCSAQRFDILPDFVGGSPFTTLAAGDIIQAAVDYLIDNGAGGAPIAFNVNARMRAYYDATYNTRTTVYSSHGPTTGSAGASTDHPALPAAEAGRLLTAKIVLDTDSSHLTVSTSLQIYVTSNQTGTYRLRVKNPQFCKVGSGLVAVTPPATAVAYTNNTQTNQQIVIAGGTVSGIAINSVATGLTSGAFILNPGDSLTLTYAVAPTSFLVKPV